MIYLWLPVSSNGKRHHVIFERDGDRLGLWIDGQCVFYCLHRDRLDGSCRTSGVWLAAGSPRAPTYYRQAGPKFRPGRRFVPSQCKAIGGFWNVGGGDVAFNNGAALAHGFRRVNLLNTYADYPGNQVVLWGWEPGRKGRTSR